MTVSDLSSLVRIHEGASIELKDGINEEPELSDTLY